MPPPSFSLVSCPLKDPIAEVFRTGEEGHLCPTSDFSSSPSLAFPPPPSISPVSSQLLGLSTEVSAFGVGKHLDSFSYPSSCLSFTFPSPPFIFSVSHRLMGSTTEVFGTEMEIVLATSLPNNLYNHVCLDFATHGYLFPSITDR